MMRLGWTVALGVMLGGCGLVDAPGTPKIEAHRAAAGNYPENSRAAVRAAVAANYPGLEFDLVLTADRVPVLSHDAWLNPELCRTAAGAELPAERIYLKDLTLSELQSGYRCGGVGDPAQPEAQVIAETHMTLDELIDEIATVPAMTLHFDIKYEEGLTLPLDAFFDEILARWNASGRTNPWYVSSTELDFLEEARARDIPGRSLTWPKFPAGSNTTLLAIEAELLAQTGIRDPIGLARSVGATAFNIPYQVIDRRMVESANQLGLETQVWTINDAEILAEYCTWPVDALITDYPERAPCLP